MKKHIVIFLLVCLNLAGFTVLDSVAQETAPSAAEVLSSDDLDTISRVITSFISRIPSGNINRMFTHVSRNFGAGSDTGFDVFKNEMQNGFFRRLKNSQVTVNSCNIVNIKQLNDKGDDYPTFRLEFSCNGISKKDRSRLSRMFYNIVKMSKEEDGWMIVGWQSDIERSFPEIKAALNKFITSVYNKKIDDAASLVSLEYIDNNNDYYEFIENLKKYTGEKPAPVPCDNPVIKEYKSFYEDDVRLTVIFQCAKIEGSGSVTEAFDGEMFFSLKKERDGWKITNCSLFGY